MMARSVCIALALLAVDVGPASAQTHVREPLSKFLQDPDKVLSLLRGVATMKARDEAPKDSAEYRTSWEYWTAIHGYPGPEDGTIEAWQQFLAQQDPDVAPLLVGFYSGLENLTAPDPLAEEVWSTCHHGTDHFFTWHRMYLYFFERVLRAASGDPSFALPYWDYTEVGTPPEEPWRIPQLFIVPQLATQDGDFANPLYEPRRTPGFGTFVQLDVAATNIDSALGVAAFLDFQSTIDAGVHAYVHCAIGNACLAPRMGIVPFAAGDPIFWHHHANVDRMWSCWLEQHREQSLPAKDSDWMKARFVFVDETGARVEMAVAELFDPKGRIDYSYDSVNAAGCFRQPPETIVAQPGVKDAATPGVAAGGSAPAGEPSGRVLARDVDLTRMSTTISMSGGPMPQAALDAADESGGAGAIRSGRAVLRLDRVEAEAQPGAAIAVELVSAATGERQRVGTIAFFALGGSGPGHAHGAASRSYAFDVTDALRDLQGQNLDEVTVELRAESLVLTPAATEPPPTELQAAGGADADDVAAALRGLDSGSVSALLSSLETSPVTAAEAGAPMASMEASAAAEERFRRANVTVGEIVLELGV